MIGRSKKQKIISSLINQKDVQTIIDVKSFSIHTKKPVAHRILDIIAEKTDTQWVGFYNKPDYLFIPKEDV